MRRICVFTIVVMSVWALLLAAGCAADDAVEPSTQQDADDGAGSADTTEDGDAPATEVAFLLTSSSLEDGAAIPDVHARAAADGGENTSVPLAFSAVPDGTMSFALVMVDRHPIAQEWIHWMVVDIPSDTDGLEFGASGSTMPTGSRELANSWGEVGYGGPEPPPGSGPHDYEITVYALDTATLDLDGDVDFATFLEAVRDHMLGAATLTGTFER